MYLTPSIEAQTSLPCTLDVIVDDAVDVWLDVCVELPDSDAVLDTDDVPVVVGVAVVAVLDTVELTEDVTVLVTVVPNVEDTVDETDDETVLVTVVDTLV